MSNWIKVEDKTPIHGKDVLVIYKIFSGVKKQTVAHYDKELNNWHEWGYGNIKGVIAWQELPNIDEL